MLEMMLNKLINMDIIIKSFNRPYYLDRCLQSIQTFVQDSKYTIMVLDDGTSQKYLDKIKIERKFFLE